MRSQLKLNILILLIRTVYFLGGGGCLWLAFYMISENSKGDYLQLPGIFLGVFFGILGIGALYQMVTLKELKNEGRARKFYNRVSIVFIKIILVLLLPALIYGLSINIKKQFGGISKAELTTIKGRITNKVEVYQGTKSSGDAIYITLKEYPGFRFDIEDEALDATDAYKYLLYVKRGERLSIDIKTEEYKKKLSKEEPLGFFDKYVNYGFISVYGLRDKNHTYLTLERYNEKDKEDAMLGILIFGGIMLYIIWLGIQDLYAWWIKRKRNVMI